MAGSTVDRGEVGAPDACTVPAAGSLVMAGTVNMAAVPVACTAQVCGPRSTVVTAGSSGTVRAALASPSWALWSPVHGHHGHIQGT